MITKISEHFLFHYPATLSNVQISCETTSNITRYLDNWLFCTTKKDPVQPVDYVSLSALPLLPYNTLGKTVLG